MLSVLPSLLQSTNGFFLFSKISDLRDKKSLLFVKHDLSFDESQAEITMNFNITDGRKFKDSDEDFKKNSGTGSHRSFYLSIFHPSASHLYVHSVLILFLFVQHLLVISFQFLLSHCINFTLRIWSCLSRLLFINSVNNCLICLIWIGPFLFILKLSWVECVLNKMDLIAWYDIMSTYFIFSIAMTYDMKSHYITSYHVISYCQILMPIQHDILDDYLKCRKYEKVHGEQSNHLHSSSIP